MGARPLGADLGGERPYLALPTECWPGTTEQVDDQSGESAGGLARALLADGVDAMAGLLGGVGLATPTDRAGVGGGERHVEIVGDPKRLLDGCAGLVVVLLPGLQVGEHDEGPGFGLAITGATNRQIAGALFISEKTASVHVSNIIRKLGVSNRGEAAAAAWEHGLASPTRDLERTLRQG